jgi:hypothetical protein
MKRNNGKQTRQSTETEIRLSEVKIFKTVFGLFKTSEQRRFKFVKQGSGEKDPQTQQTSADNLHFKGVKKRCIVNGDKVHRNDKIKYHKSPRVVSSNGYRAAFSSVFGNPIV